ncbi:hypothetical protein C475_15699 [Halosimplex carlsbadense 2-9-1]|uniref:Pectate lyase superfamily protein domain-containing protein n=1 Tax=Halosimplex carlsbadense 2-9-1 TaxID=797114 RepID=M0CL69_9EURY|nr:hypothetical protein [Halosimplex carlsbadense]ELZ23107.1 hypothetical protein C475_15699 [Halosimplex carlsbadense 2-9-1]
MNRRQFLGLVGVAATGGVTGCNWLGSNDRPERSRTSSPSATQPAPTEAESPSTSTASPAASPTPTAEPEFRTVVDVVADYGCVPDGSEPCNDAINEAIADGTLIEFPPGEYLVTRPIEVDGDITFGMRGTGETRRDVRFVHPEGYSSRLLHVTSGSGSLFENFTADQTDDRVTNSGLLIHQRDGLVVRDVEVAGFTPTDNGTKDLVVQITDSSGVGTVERYVNRGGGEVGVYPDAFVGFYSGRHHYGTLRLLDCHIEQCGSNGVYASRTNGPVQISGGTYRNNAVSQIRVCGQDSFVRDATIEIDTDAADRVDGTYNAVRGIWWESGWQGKSGGAIENCELAVRSAELARGLVEVDGTAGHLAVRDCAFDVDRDGFRAIQVAPPGVSDMGGTPDRPWDVTLRDVEIDTSASRAVDVLVDGRPGSEIDGLTISQRDSRERDGLFLSNSSGSRVTRYACESSRYPLWVYTDDSSDAADELICLGPGVSIATSASVGSEQIPVFGTDESAGGSNVCVETAVNTPYSVASTRNEDGTYFGRVLDRSPAYLEYTQA